MSDETDAVTGLPVVDPDSVEFDVTIRNRGDSASTPSTLRLTWGFDASDGRFFELGTARDTVPGLGPGGRFDARVRVPSSERNGALPRSAPWTDDLSRGTAVILEPDADTTNNHAGVGPAHVRIADIAFEVGVPDTAVTVNAPAHGRVITAHLSRHGSLDPASVGFILCVYVTPTHCDNHYGEGGFGAFDLPLLAPAAADTTDLTFTIPIDAARQDVASRYGMVLLLVPRGTPDSVLYHADSMLRIRTTVISVHPDFSACLPATLVAGDTVWVPVVCDQPQRFSLFRLDARTDREYDYTELPDAYGVRLVRADGADFGSWRPGEWRHFDAEGTWFLVDYVSPYSDSSDRPITLLGRPLPATASRR